MQAGATAVLDAGGPGRRRTVPPPAGAHRAARAGVSGPPWYLAFAVYLAGSLVLHRRVLPDLAGRATGWASSDSTLFVWWLHWTPFRLAAGADPFHTDWLNAGDGGVNPLWNTSVPLLGTMLSPVTLTGGPMVAFNIGMILGPAVSGLAAWTALAPYAGRAGRTLGGALYAFSPFVIAHSAVGHLNLVWLVLPPVLLWALRETFVLRRPWRAGVVTGLALTVQTGIYTQMIALGAAAVLVALVVLAAARPRRILDRLPDAARAAGSAALVWVVLCAYPLWLVLAGPARPRGIIRDPVLGGVDAAGLVVPAAYTALRAGTEPLAARIVDPPGEQGAYLGLPLILVVALTAVVVRSRPVRLAAVTGSVLALLGLGAGLRLLGEPTGVALPWRLVHAVALVGQAEAARLGPFTVLCAALVAAVALDRAVPALVTPGPGSACSPDVHSPRRGRAGRAPDRPPPLSRRRAVLVLAGVFLLVVSWRPADTQVATDAAAPPFFAAGAPGLTADDVVATWPRPSGRWEGGADPMLWQSASGFAFRLVGGYFIGSDADTPVQLEGDRNAYDLGRAGPGVEAARADLDRLGVSAVVVVPAAVTDDLGDVLAWTRDVTGTPGVATGGVWVFRR